jgi:hypothetical protein
LGEVVELAACSLAELCQGGSAKAVATVLAAAVLVAMVLVAMVLPAGRLLPGSRWLSAGSLLPADHLFAIYLPAI